MKPSPRLGLVAISMAVAATAGVSLSAQQQPLTQLQFDIVGVRLVVDPPTLTVPKNIATQINTSLALPPNSGPETRAAIDTLTDGAIVEAELRGPDLPPTRIVTRAGQPIPIPPLAIPGDYFLDGIRLVKNGKTILDATAPDGRLATTIPIRVISEVFVTNVTSRPLSLDEIRGKGIVIDQNNFRAVNFQVAFNIDGAPFTINLPAALPTPEFLQQRPTRAAVIEQLTAINQKLRAPRNAAAAAVRSARAQLLDRRAAVLPGRGRRRCPVARRSADYRARRHSGQHRVPQPVLLRAADGDQRRARRHDAGAARDNRHDRAPDGPRSRAWDIRPARRRPAAPGAHRRHRHSADSSRACNSGRTACETRPTTSPSIRPQTTGEAEFLVEGLKEGSHLFDLEIQAMLYGLPSGPVKLMGLSAGAVFVRNPTFSVTLAHPRTIRSGERYDLYATVTNTSQSAANLVSVNLDPRGISGAQLISDQSVTFDAIAAGQAATAKFTLIAQKTGEVTFSSFTGEAAAGGGIQLTTGVDERGVPLAPECDRAAEERRQSALVPGHRRAARARSGVQHRHGAGRSAAAGRAVREEADRHRSRARSRAGRRAHRLRRTTRPGDPGPAARLARATPRSMAASIRFCGRPKPVPHSSPKWRRSSSSTPPAPASSPTRRRSPRRRSDERHTCPLQWEAAPASRRRF